MSATPIRPPAREMAPLEAAIRAEVDTLVDAVIIEEDPITLEVNYRLRESLLRIADRLGESA